MTQSGAAGLTLLVGLALGVVVQWRAGLAEERHHEAETACVQVHVADERPLALCVETLDRCAQTLTSCVLEEGERYDVYEFDEVDAGVQ
jgi:hypothetical protein